MIWTTLRVVFSIRGISSQHTLFGTFLCHHCTTTTWIAKFHISSTTWTYDDKFLFLSLNLNFFLKNDWTKWASWDNGTEVSKNEKPLFTWHFCHCCGHGILNCLKCPRGRYCFMPVYGLYTYMLLWRVGFPRSLVWDECHFMGNWSLVKEY